MASNEDLIQTQKALCDQHGAAFLATPPYLKVGIARNVKMGLKPLNGLRHPPDGDTCGWYIWAGETLSNDPDFFVPLHVEHLIEWCPEALKYLGLPPGWRFLTNGVYEDVWEDKSLLNVYGHN